MKWKNLSLFACVGALAAVPVARADSPTQPESYAEPAEQATPSVNQFGYEWSEPGLYSKIGINVVAGGGIMGFTNKDMRNSVTSNVGGLWSVRAAIGSHIPVGVDVSYVGTANNVNTLGGTPNGTLVGTTLEAAVRYNILPHYLWNPYIFAGIGWQRYDLTSSKVATSDSGMKESDNVAAFPMGAGLSYRDKSGVTVDLRGTFRPTTNSTLLLNQETQKHADLHSWDASATVGYEF